MQMKLNKYRILFKFSPSLLWFALIGFGFMTYSITLHAADYIYISDNLRVGVRTEPVSGVPPISVVYTGMRLEVHERADGYVRITTDKGVMGWIKDIYVTQKAPAIIQLNVLNLKYNKLRQQLSQENNTAEVLEKANLALNEQVDELKAERREWSKERADILASQYNETSWYWIIGIFLLVLLSFSAGIFWYKASVMKRLGGLRI